MSEDQVNATPAATDRTPPVDIEPLGDGVRFLLPPPGIGRSRFGAWLAVVFGNLLILGAGSAAIYFQYAAINNRWSLIPIWIAAGVAVIIGLVFVNAGLSFLIGRHSIELRSGILTVIHRHGLISTRRRIPLLRIRRLHITLAIPGDAMEELSEPVEEWVASMKFSLFAELDSGSRKPLLRWITLPYAQQLAEALVKQMAEHFAHRNVAADVPAIIVDSRIVDHAPGNSVDASRPPNTDIEITESPDELSIVVPKLPFIRATGGRSVGSILVSAIAATAVGAFLFSGIGGGGFSWFWLALLLPAGLTWGGFLINHIGGRDTYIDVVDGTLLISRATLLGVKIHQWTRHEINAIRCGKSDLEVNDKHLPQLEIVARRIDDARSKQKDEKKGFLVGRSREEISWIAWNLRRQLDVPATPDARSDPNDEGNRDAGHDAPADEPVFRIE